MTTTILRSTTSLAVCAAVLALLILPLCGAGLFAAHLCPMELAMQGHEGGCQGPAGPGLKRQTMDCCVAPQAASPPAMQSATLHIIAPAAQPISTAAVTAPDAAESLRVVPRILPRSSDLLQLNTSLLL